MGVTVFPDVMPEVDLYEGTESDVKMLPPYVVIILNDDHHSFEFVIDVLMKIIRCPVEQAFQFAKEAHDSGRAIVWRGSKEVAEFKKEQMETFREKKNGQDIGPLGVEIEPAYG